MTRALILLLFLIGCNTPLTHIGTVEIDSVKREYFTPEAYEVIKDIPMEYGLAIGGYAAGTNFWSKVASFITFHGVGRKVIVDREYMKLGQTDTILHEYIHHLDDIGRDGGTEWINLEEFAEGYMECYGHEKYHGIIVFTEDASNKWQTDIFGIGDYSEHIAYVGSLISQQGCPAKLRWAFRKILKERK